MKISPAICGAVLLLFAAAQVVWRVEKRNQARLALESAESAWFGTDFRWIRLTGIGSRIFGMFPTVISSTCGGHMRNSPLWTGNVSQRGLLSLAMLLFSVGGLSISLLAGARLVFDIFSAGLMNSLDGLLIKVIVIGLAYGVGWLTSMLAIRVYGNLVLPFIINLFIWGCLIGVCALYLLTLQRLFDQRYDLPHFIAYILVMGAGLASMVGLHLIIEGHNLRPLALPLLIINLIQLGLIVLRYVFTPDAKPGYLILDLVFFAGMTAFSAFMLAHIGVLAPLRNRLTNYFDRNSVAIRTED